MNKYEVKMVEATKEVIRLFAQAVANVANDSEGCTTWHDVQNVLEAIKTEYLEFEDFVMIE